MNEMETPERMTIRKNSFLRYEDTVCADCAKTLPEHEIEFVSGATVLLCSNCLGQLKSAIEQYEKSGTYSH